MDKYENERLDFGHLTISLTWLIYSQRHTHSILGYVATINIPVYLATTIVFIWIALLG